MASKTTEWRPGPTVCRCCLTEGCYKDISTEYFWMGKREVYADMLSETFDLSIAYSQSGGPNSHSRLICEPCISRLRDAADFKRQVQECERTFTQYLDPGSSLAELEVGVDLDKEVKVERVKVEKEQSDDEEFDDRPDFGDDDDYDDLDDEPLTKLASKIPKKESVDVLDLIDNAKVSVKRKSSSKTKATPAKKAKTKKDTATSSKEKPEPRKKKGGNYAEVKIKLETDISTEDNTNVSVTKADGTNRGMDDRLAAFRNNIAIIMGSCTAYPFKYEKGSYLCFFCKNTFLEPEKLREHTQKDHSGLMFQLKKYVPLKMDFAVTYCKLCGITINNYVSLKSHLREHGKALDSSYGEPILPYKLIKNEYCCQVCGKQYETFLSLHKHMPSHNEHINCDTCGKGFATARRMLNHSRTHERTDYPCQHCEEILESYASLTTHIDKVHRLNKSYKCPICDETFTNYRHRKTHLSKVHG